MGKVIEAGCAEAKTATDFNEIAQKSKRSQNPRNHWSFETPVAGGHLINECYTRKYQVFASFSGREGGAAAVVADSCASATISSKFHSRNLFTKFSTR